MKFDSINILALLLLANLAFSQGLSKKCVDEILVVPENKQNFDLQNFLTKDLPAEVVKVKAQMKLPFGKPKDDKVTYIGVTVGCLKGFPENPDQIQSMLKDVSLEIAKRTAIKSGTNALTGDANSSLSNIGTVNKANVNKSSEQPALKECDAVFNPKKRFCYDGEVYDLCDEMQYNPKTHICSGYIANRALCNGTQYNPLTHKCKNDIVISVCGESEYNPKTQGCKDGKVFSFPKCGETFYNLHTHGCGPNQTLLTKCGTDSYYNSEKYNCENGIVVHKRYWEE